MGSYLPYITTRLYLGYHLRMLHLTFLILGLSVYAQAQECDTSSAKWYDCHATITEHLEVTQSIEVVNATIDCNVPDHHNCIGVGRHDDFSISLSNIKGNGKCGFIRVEHHSSLRMEEVDASNFGGHLMTGSVIYAKDESTANIINSRFHNNNNVASVSTWSSITMVGCDIYDNSNESAVDITHGSTANLIGTRIYNNHGAKIGGGLRLQDYSEATLTECTIEHNSAHKFGGGVNADGSLNLVGTDIQHNKCPGHEGSKDVHCEGGSLQKDEASHVGSTNCQE